MKAPARPAAVNDSAVQRFLGLLEGYGCKLPVAWENALSTSVIGTNDMLGFRGTPSLLNTGRIGLDIDRPFTVSRNSEGLLIVAQNGKWQIPFAADGVIPNKIAFASDGVVNCIAVYSWPPNSFKIHCFVGEKHLWSKSVVAAADRQFQGQGWHTCFCNVNGKFIDVYGVSEGSAYIQRFYSCNGDTAFSFLTLDASAP